MSMTILSVAYPFAPIAPETPGGAEQVLLSIDRKLVERGHQSIVLASHDSQVAGVLVPMPSADGPIEENCRARVHCEYAAALSRLIASRRIDVVHMHGIDFESYLPPPGPAVLVTLHVPIAWYSPAALHPLRGNTHLVCVSERQQQDAGKLPNLLPAIENGIDVGAFAGGHAKREFALMLSRICPEKGIHLALDAARRAHCPVLLAGRVFPYEDHRCYFAKEVVPRLGQWARYIGQVGPDRKRRLLAAARCVVIASTVPETSSLVAREALAAGTAVVAFSRGSLVDVIDPGQTGFLVKDIEEMTEAIAKASEINPECCRAAARRRFSDERMFESYNQLYTKLSTSVQ